MFWYLAKTVQGNFCLSFFPTLHKVDGSLAHVVKEKAYISVSLIATSLTVDDQRTIDPTIPQCHSSMAVVKFHQTEERKAPISLEVHKLSWPDSISSIELMICVPESAQVLTHLFRLSFLQVAVHKNLKTSLVKKGDSSYPSNYRCTATTFLFSKTIEFLINSQLLTKLEEHQLISNF